MPRARGRGAIWAFAGLGAMAALAALDRANPPDLTRAHMLSPEVADARGRLLRPFLAADGAWRLETKADDVAPRYLTLLKAYEDSRFDLHPGVDLLAVIRAAFQLASTGRAVSGASTLTMQVARLLEPRPRGVIAKLVQSARAVQLELRYSKEEILGLYLTLAPYGGNLEGARAASLAYFGKEPRVLSLGEAALLVALPQSPERQRPDRHTEAARAGRDKVLMRLSEAGVIPGDEAAQAMREPVPAVRLPMPLSAPHLAERLARRQPDSHVIATTIDGELQDALERLARREAQFLDDNANLAIVAVDSRTRRVIGYVGNADYWGPAGQMDLGERPRSPGSVLKPFIYGLAFDDLILHPMTEMQDMPVMFGDYAPKNFDGGFAGAVTAGDALRMSLNVPAVMALERVGPVRFALMLRHAGTRLALPAPDASATLPVALGGLGITLTDIAMLYAGIAEGGAARPLRMLAGEPQGRPFRMFGPAAAFYLRDILSGAALPDGWAMGQGLKRPRDIAFKTGTSYGYRDAWAAGFSNDYTVAVWAGRPDGTPRPGRYGRNEAAPVLLKAFDLLPADRNARPAAPDDAIRARTTAELPPALRSFARRTEAPARLAARVPAPAIAFPPNGATVALPEGGHDLVLRAEGGRAPLTWLVNGEVLGSFGRFDTAHLAPDGEGFARITVVDAEGRSATSEVKFKRAP